MIKTEELNLNNPIFVVYVNIDGYSAEKSEGIIQNYIDILGIYKNATFWFMTSKESKIECVYDGLALTKSKELSKLINEINNRIDILSKCKSFEDFKIEIRNWRINNLIDVDKEE